MISCTVAKAAPWECRCCGASTSGAALLVADSPEREIAPTEITKAATLESAAASPTIDERLLRCPWCGSREIEIPIEVLDTKRLR